MKVPYSNKYVDLFIRQKTGTVIVFFACILFSCRNTSNSKPDQPYSFNLPLNWNPPTTLPDNPVTVKRVELGKLLFYDPIVSDDSTVSCATCHIPELAFTDGKKLPIGLKGSIGKRNSPTLVNVAYYPYFFSEGKVPDLETQALAPGLHDAEMGTEMKQMIFRLRKNKFYKRKFKDTFGCDTIELKHFVYAIASYERTLISYNNRYQQNIIEGDKAPLTNEEILGKKIFFGKANCSQCHLGNLFTDFSLQNIGLYERYEDPGLARANNLAIDSGKFKTPTLLNVEYTAPYMHDGSLATLEEVVEFYNSGGRNHPNKNQWIQPLKLSDDEKKSLVAFLKTLTDTDLKNKEGIFKTPQLVFE